MEDASVTTDPDEKVVLYVVVRQSLKLIGGKIGAQVGHAVMFIVEEAACPRGVTMCGETLELPEEKRHQYHERMALYREWRQGEYGKIVLAASDDDFLLAKERYGTDFLVVDNGHTQVDPNTETCVGIWPMRKKARCELLLRLKPLR